MKGKKIMRLLGFLAFCLICLWAVGENAWAAEKKVPYDTALRVHFKNWGCHRITAIIPMLAIFMVTARMGS